LNVVPSASLSASTIPTDGTMTITAGATAIPYLGAPESQYTTAGTYGGNTR
jgi:hypothetical protein